MIVYNIVQFTLLDKNVLPALYFLLTLIVVLFSLPGKVFSHVFLGDAVLLAFLIEQSREQLLCENLTKDSSEKYKIE